MTRTELTAVASSSGSYLDKGPATEQELRDLKHRVDQVMNLCNVTAAAYIGKNDDVWGTMKLPSRELDRIGNELSELEDRAGTAVRP